MGDSFLHWLMNIKFRLFSPVHIAILLITALMIGLLFAYRKSIRKEKPRLFLGYLFAAVLLSARVFEQIAYASQGIWNLLYSLPLHLCGISSIVCILMLALRSYRMFEVMYFWCLIGSPLAMVSPNLNGSSLDPLFWLFFVSHVMNIISVFFMITAYQYRPTLGSVKRAILYTNAYILFIVVYNFAAGANYYFFNLDSAPSPNLAFPLRYFHSWPMILVLLEVFAMVTALALYLPYMIRDIRARKRAAAQPVQSPAAGASRVTHHASIRKDTGPARCGAEDAQSAYPQKGRPSIQQRQPSGGDPV